MKHFYLFFVSIIAFAQIPTYYQSVDFSLNGNALKQELATLITNTQTTLIPYTSSSTDTWDVVKQADLDSNSTTNVLLMYGFDDNDNDSDTDRLRSKDLSCHTSSCTGKWNREHVFAKSWGNPSFETNDPGVGTDIHNLRACDTRANSSRSNRKFIDGTGTGSDNIGTSEYYPGSEWKGDVARIIMYMYVRYDAIALANEASNSSHTYHADMPDLFLIWNEEDPVSELEIQRNNVIASYQGNRNPFIDNPYLATKIWGGVPATDSWDVLEVEDILTDASTLKIYPNPVNSRLTISENITQAEVFNFAGQKLLQTKENPIDVSVLKNGTYIISIQTEEGKTIQKQFTKN